MKEIFIENKGLKNNYADNDYANISSNQIENFFTQINLEDLANEKKFTRRVSKITARWFVVGSLTALLRPHCITSMTLLTETIKDLYTIEITRQALCIKLKNKACKFFLRAVLKKAIEKLKSENTTSDSAFSKFSNVLLRECTSVEVKKQFKSNNENQCLSSKVTKKIFMLIDISSYGVNFVDLFKENETDTSIYKKCFNNMKKNSLATLDLSFFSMDILKKFEARESYFLMRLKSTSEVYLNKEDTAPINLVDYIKSNVIENGFLDQTVYITQQKVKVRLVTSVVKEEVVNKRIQSHKEKENEAPSDELINWFSISAYVTNVSKETSSSDEVVRLYEMVCQLELVFKNCKSNLQLNTYDISNENVIDSLIYMRLLLFILETFYKSDS